MPNPTFEYRKGTGHLKKYLNTKILDLMAGLAFDDFDLEMYEKLVEMRDNQGVNTEHIKFRGHMAIYMYDHGYAHRMGTDKLEKFFEYLGRVYSGK